jgi:hypothetical protein
LDISTEDFRRHFDLLSDEALLGTNRDELTEAAQRVYNEEVEKRGLNVAPEEVAAEAEEPHAPEASPDAEELMIVATYDDAEEANEAKARLEEAMIPARLTSDPRDMEGVQMELLVPNKDFFRALDALGLEITDEELAAQAEAAGMEPEEA